MQHEVMLEMLKSLKLHFVKPYLKGMKDIEEHFIWG